MKHGGIKMVASFVLLSLMLLAYPQAAALAEGKITVDPNGPGTKSEAASKDAAVDERLAQKVTYEARYTAVKKILDDLAGLTGVKFYAGTMSSDWCVRDRRMSIFVKDTTLAALMNSMARTMKFKWSKNVVKQPPTYRLYMPTKTLLGAEEKVFEFEEQLEEKATNNRETFLQWILYGEKPSGADLELMRQSDPYRYLMYKRGTYDYLRAMFLEKPGLQRYFLQSIPDVEYRVSNLSERTQELLLHAVQEEYKTINPPYMGDGKPFPAEYAAKLVSEGKAIFELQPRTHSWRVGQRDWHFGGIGVNIGGRFFAIGELRDLADSRTQASAKAECEATEQGVAFRYMSSVEDAMSEQVAKSSKEGTDQLADEPVEHPDEPALHVKVKLEESKERLAGLVGLQARLAKASGLSVVSDSFRKTQGSANVGTSEKELIEVLNAIADGYFYNWEKHGSVIEFRNRHWFKFRSYQIPDDWIQTWRNDTIKNGYIPLDVYAKIALLSYDQIEENLLYDEVLGSMPLGGWPMNQNLEVLRFYSMLSAAQRKPLFAPGGLDCHLLTPEQTMQAAVMMHNTPVNGGRVTAGYDREKKGWVVCNLELFGKDGEKLRTWSIDLPTYVPIKKDSQPQTGLTLTVDKKPAESLAK